MEKTIVTRFSGSLEKIFLLLDDNFEQSLSQWVHSIEKKNK